MRTLVATGCVSAFVLMAASSAWANYDTHILGASCTPVHAGAGNPMWGQHPNHADKIIYSEWGVFLDGTNNSPNTADFQCVVPAPNEINATNGPLINVASVVVWDRHETLDVSCTLTIITTGGVISYQGTQSTSGTPGLTALSFPLGGNKYGIAHYKCTIPQKSSTNPNGWSGIAAAKANYLQ